MKDIIPEIIKRQRTFFNTNETKSVDFRIHQLKKLRQAIENHLSDIYEALWKDLHKSEEEAFLTEINIVLTEINDHIKNFKKWVKPTKVRTPLYLKPSSSYIVYEPFGLSLIIAPWNYPFNLMFTPLVGAISSGCCAVLKPSPYSKNTSEVMQMIVNETFNDNYIAMIQGHRDVNQALLEEKFDFIFYTGSPDTGKVVMEAASKNLTPLVLELGGKSPCIVDEKSNIDFAAKRIVWGKTINAGQTCVAPDYLMVHHSVKQKLIDRMIYYVEKFYGKNSQESNTYCRIINDKSYNRLVEYLNEGRIVYGGNCDSKDRYIQFTLIEDVDKEASVLSHEIFGPILPIITFNDLEEVVAYVTSRPKPLALYYFGDNYREIINRTSSGGCCINDTILHVANEHLPFGGVGESGMGKYHSYDSFLAFSNKRAVLKSSNRIDFDMKYPPYDKINMIKKMM